MPENRGRQGIVITSDFTWIAAKNIFLKNGFEMVDQHGGFELLRYPLERQPSTSAARLGSPTGALPGLATAFTPTSAPGTKMWKNYSGAQQKKAFPYS